MHNFIHLPETIILSPLNCFSKKRLFEEIAQCASSLLGGREGNKITNPSHTILRSLQGREMMGSTVVCDRFAIPHCAPPGNNHTLAVLALLAQPVPYNTVDTEHQLIDIVYSFFFSVSDEVEHGERMLELLAEIMSGTSVRGALQRVRHDHAKLALNLRRIDALLHARLLSSSEAEKSA